MIVRQPDIAGIQYLRGIAAAMVVFHHIIFQWSQITGEYYKDNLASGVDIFFIISGFVMIYSTNIGDISVNKFLVRRIIRIVPLYWAATIFTILVIVVYPAAVKSSKLDWSHAAASLAFVAAHNPVYNDFSILSYGPLVAPGWTLNLEMFFYIIFAVAIFFAKERDKLFLSILALPLFVLSLVGWVVAPGGWLGFYTQDIILEFLLGAILGVVWLKHARVLPTIIGLPLLAVAFLLLVYLPAYDGSRLLRYGLLAFAIGILGVWTKFPKIRWLHLLGDASYSIYLSHFFVLSAVAQLWKRLDLSSEGFAVFALASGICALIGGFLCWRIVELPLAHGLKRLTGRRASARS